MVLLNEIKPYKPIGPGIHIRELMAMRKWDVIKLAKEMRFDPDEVNEILGDSLPMNHMQADALESVFGVSGQFWLNLDRKYHDKKIWIEE